MSKDYWIRSNSNQIIISQIKKNYLNFLKSDKTTAEIARYFNVDFKSSFRRLNELEKLSLVRRNKNKKWERIETEKEIIVK